VPAFLHRQFKDALGGAELDADTKLRAWYDRVMDALPADGAVPSDVAKFWRPLFDAEFVTMPVKPARDREAELQADAESIRAFLAKEEAMYK
jgi:hypothetical protein